METGISTERASTTIESAGLVAVVAALTVSLGAVFMTDGGVIGAKIGRRIDLLVRGEMERRPSSSPASVRLHRATAARTVDIRRERALGTQPPRVSRADLRPSSTIPRGAWRAVDGEFRLGDAASSSAARARVRGRACLLCFDPEWRTKFDTGMIRRASTKDAAAGIGGQLEGRASAALAATEVLAEISQATGWGRWHATGRGRVLAGGDVDVRASAMVARDRIDAELRGGAMAGAIARGEAAAGFELLGIAVSASARAEGWAGAGARGRAAVRHEDGKTTVTVGAGAALGLGGAAEWSGSIDASRIPLSHRQAASATLMHALTMAQPGAGIVIRQLFAPPATTPRTKGHSR